MKASASFRSGPTPTHIDLDLDYPQDTSNFPDQLLELHSNDITSNSSSSNLNRSKIWIHVQTFAEGMGCWRRALIEVLLVAKKLNATFVEPCISRGRLVSCGGTKKHLLLSFRDLFDMKELYRLHPFIATFDEYQALIVENHISRDNIYTWCMNTGSPPTEKVCAKAQTNDDSSTVFSNFHGHKHIEPLERALLNHARTPTESMILNIHHFRKDGFANALHANQSLLETQEDFMNIVDRSFTFQPQLHARVDMLLKEQLGIVDGVFDVIHWRAELESMDYSKCVAHILQSKKLLSRQNSGKVVPTVLISSLNMDPKKQWKRSDNYQKQHQSLRALQSAGILKIDMSNVSKGSSRNTLDLFHFAAWDLIMAEKARKFATCTTACNAKSACAACNHRGSFALTAMGYRSRNGKRSDECWPE